MKQILLSRIIVMILVAFSSLSNAQIISQYVETNAGTTPKGIEIWNNTGATLDFSANPLRVLQGTNGAAATTQQTVIDSGSLASGAVLVIGTSDMQTYLTNQGLTSIMFVDRAFSFNGDDSLVITYGGATTDTFGTPGSDPGSAWSGSGVSTANQNIQLLSGIAIGSSGFTDPSVRFETVSTDPSGANGLAGFGVAPAIPAGNQPPSITNIAQNPANPTSTQFVVISATIEDSDGAISSAILNYDIATNGGSFDGTYDSSINLSASGSIYSGTIPATDLNNSVVYFQISATDDNSTPATTNSAALSYVVVDPQAQGLQLVTVDTKYVIDFETTVEDVNNGVYTGSGFALVPGAGQLDADAFAFEGFNDGNTTFGDERDSGDFARGVSTGGETTGGIYAFQVSDSPSNVALGIQPTGTDFTPGTMFFQFTNDTGEIINKLSIGYDIYFRNNETRANNVIFSHGVDTANLIALPSSEVSSGLEPDAATAWQKYVVSIDIEELNIADGATYVLAWTSTDQGGGSSDELAFDDIQIIANPVSQVLTSAGTVESLTLLGDLTLDGDTDLYGSLNLFGGNLSTNDNLTFKSVAGKAAVVSPVISGSVIGDVTVEQFFPATTGRAFRFVSAPVNFDGSITANWQEGGSNAASFGVQITGGDLADGYDPSATNNPSLFRYDNGYTDPASAWIPLSTANGDDLTSISPEAGDAYRLFVRGDRTTDLTSNTPVATATTLRATGTLVTGAYPATPIALAGPNLYSLIGNPYQSKVDVEQLLQNATNVIATEYWQWDPTTNNYVLYEFATPTTPTGSVISKNALPGQSFFVQSDATGNGSLQFQESYKTAGSDVATKNVNVSNALTINLSTQEQIASGKANDIAIARFDEESRTDFDPQDTQKFFGLSHSLAWEKNGAYYAVNRAAMPQDGDRFNLSVFVGASGTYSFTVQSPEFEGLTTYFYDSLSDTYDLVTPNNPVVISKSIDLSNSSSTAGDRFQIVFRKSTLGMDSNFAFAKAISLFPNPSSGDAVSISNLEAGKPVSFKIFNTLGQQVLTVEKTISGTIETINGLDNLANGLYLVNVYQNDLQTSIKLILN